MTDSTATRNVGDTIAWIKYLAKRKNIPPAGLEAQGVVQDAPKIRYEYNPHLPPVLRSAIDATEADKLPELLDIARQRALSEDGAKVLAKALRRHEPWLEWSGATTQRTVWKSLSPGIAQEMEQKGADRWALNGLHERGTVTGDTNMI